MKHTNEKKAKPTLTESEIRDTLALPNGAMTLYQKSDPNTAVPAVFRLFMTDRAVPAAAYLCRAAKSKQPRGIINALLDKTNREPLQTAILSDDPKLRKNTARLIGALENPRDTEILTLALSRETTLFVIPSIILALGTHAENGENSEIARDALINYSAPKSEPDQARLLRDIEEALALARGKFIKHAPHKFTGLSRDFQVELRYPRGLGAGLVYELNRLRDVTPVSRAQDSILIRTGNYEALFKMRMFKEALFPVYTADGDAVWHETDFTEMAKRSRAALLSLMGCHDGGAPYTYRMEIRLPNTDKKSVARAFSEVLDADGIFLNATSGYETELRLSAADSGCTLHIKLFTAPDTRFSYRQADVPASIDPVTAAALMGAARDVMHFAPGARVLDICCGSGTLLIERERLCGAGKPSALCGLDITRRAIDAARTNAKAANSRAHFLHTDCLKYSLKPNERCHEIISNLPFGNRVGNHNNNRSLYEGIARKLPEWLTPDGTALLYTADKKLLYNIVQKTPQLTLLREIKTTSGGLSPSGFVIKLKR